MTENTMNPSLLAFCQDVDQATKDLSKFKDPKVTMPSVGDQLLLMRGKFVTKVEVVNVVKSHDDEVAIMTAKIIAVSAALTNPEQYIDTVLSGTYHCGQSTWSDADNHAYQDYRLYIKSKLIKSGFMVTMPLRLRGVKAENTRVSLELGYPIHTPLFQQSCTVKDALKWSLLHNHYTINTLYQVLLTVKMGSGLVTTAQGIISISRGTFMEGFVLVFLGLMFFIWFGMDVADARNNRNEVIAEKEKIDQNYQIVRNTFLSLAVEDSTKRDIYIEFFKKDIVRTLEGFRYFAMLHIKNEYLDMAYSRLQQARRTLDSLPPTATPDQMVAIMDALNTEFDLVDS